MNYIIGQEIAIEGIKMSWNIVISSDDCDAHPDYIYGWKERCNLIGKCNYEKCPRKYVTKDDLNDTYQTNL